MTQQRYIAGPPGKMRTEPRYFRRPPERSATKVAASKLPSSALARVRVRIRDGAKPKPKPSHMAVEAAVFCLVRSPPLVARLRWLVGQFHATGGHDRHTFLHRRSLRQDRGAASAFGGSTTCTATAKWVSACSNHLTVPPFRPRRSMWLVGHVHATGGHEKVTVMHRERPRQDQGAASAFGGSTTCTATEKGVSAC